MEETLSISEIVLDIIKNVENLCEVTQVCIPSDDKDLVTKHSGSLAVSKSNSDTKHSLSASTIGLVPDKSTLKCSLDVAPLNSIANNIDGDSIVYDKTINSDLKELDKAEIPLIIDNADLDEKIMNKALVEPLPNQVEVSADAEEKSDVIVITNDEVIDTLSESQESQTDDESYESVSDYFISDSGSDVSIDDLLSAYKNIKSSQKSRIKKEKDPEEVISPSSEELNFLRFKSQFKLKSAWENIFEKYGKDLISDEIDLNSGKVIVDRGCLRDLDKIPLGSTVNIEVKEDLDEARRVFEELNDPQKPLVFHSPKSLYKKGGKLEPLHSFEEGYISDERLEFSHPHFEDDHIENSEEFGKHMFEDHISDHAQFDQENFNPQFQRPQYKRHYSCSSPIIEQQQTNRFYRAQSEENEYPLYQNQNYYDDGYYNRSKRVRTFRVVRQPVMMIPQRFQVMYSTPLNHYYQDDHLSYHSSCRELDDLSDPQDIVKAKMSPQDQSQNETSDEDELLK